MGTAREGEGLGSPSLNINIPSLLYDDSRPGCCGNLYRLSIKGSISLTLDICFITSVKRRKCASIKQVWRVYGATS